MDDFTSANFYEARNEYTQRLINTLTSQIIMGIHSMFDRTYQTCVATNELPNYLCAFQMALSSIAKWNSNTIETERKRIMEKSQCMYLEDLVTCVHLVQVKVLTCIRVGSRQKKIDVVIPKLDTFIHNIYISVARKLYTNVYLFQINKNGLEVQRNNREIEIIVQECIMNVVRDSIPTEQIIRAYLDESIEEEEEVTIEPMHIAGPEDSNNTSKNTVKEASVGGNKDTEPETQQTMVPVEPSISNLNNDPIITRLTFNDVDYANDGEHINAPKSIDRLEALGQERHMQRKMDELTNDDDDHPPIVIGEQPMSLDDIFDLNVDISSKPGEHSLMSDLDIQDI